MNKTKYIHQKGLFAGMCFTFLFAIAGYSLSFVPGFDRLGPLASAILLAIIFRQIFGYPELFRKGITFSSKYLLRFAIILYGLKLNIDVILQEGVDLLVKGLVIIVLAISLTLIFAKLFKANTNISLLLGIGTGVCGAAAIAATAPIIKSKDEDTAISVGIIALVGTIFSIIYALILPFLPISNDQYGIWSGLSLHELAHVALAAEPAGEEALAIALLAKLGRVFLLVPLCFILILWVKNRKNVDNGNRSQVTFPWFLIGFIGMSLFGSYVLGRHIPMSQNLMDGISLITTFILTSAMVGLGLNVSLKDVKEKALRPLLAMLITSVIVSVLMFWIAGI
ncbi:putative sulfate exporter family transporter [Oceanobacillus zhaokaii]|uniref:Putative sulfate exporter family transporter n=1 Tax=Oceanobacillus zhaokaii TaxID=2052660 RepID=A0A345PJ62_9BACI|nr:putative sulfate exporter family transporter [Oceanobacillus zhaokaii]AXI10042.1 putative sulfate exporter family transporter [Oceanobacillus zhaokaii]